MSQPRPEEQSAFDKAAHQLARTLCNQEGEDPDEIIESMYGGKTRRCMLYTARARLLFKVIAGTATQTEKLRLELMVAQGPRQLTREEFLGTVSKPRSTTRVPRPHQEDGSHGECGPS